MTVPGLDLSGVAAAVDQWLADELVISRNLGESDDTLDPETGQLVSGGDVVVYAGRGAIQPLSGYTAMQDPDVARIVEETGARYRALLPHDVTVEFEVGDALWVAAVNSPSADPLLATRVFGVVDLGAVSSFSAARFLYLKQTARTTDPGVEPPRMVLTGEGPPDESIAALPGSTYVDTLTGTVYELQP